MASHISEPIGSSRVPPRATTRQRDGHGTIGDVTRRRTLLDLTTADAVRRRAAAFAAEACFEDFF